MLALLAGVVGGCGPLEGVAELEGEVVFEARGCEGQADGVLLSGEDNGELAVTRAADGTLLLDLTAPSTCKTGSALCRGARFAGPPACDRFDVWLEYITDVDVGVDDDWVDDLIEDPVGWKGSVDARCIVPGEGTLVVEARWEGC